MIYDTCKLIKLMALFTLILISECNSSKLIKQVLIISFISYIRNGFWRFVCCSILNHGAGRTPPCERVRHGDSLAGARGVPKADSGLCRSKSPCSPSPASSVMLTPHAGPEPRAPLPPGWPGRTTPSRSSPRSRPAASSRRLLHVCRFLSDARTARPHRCDARLLHTRHRAQDRRHRRDGYRPRPSNKALALQQGASTRPPPAQPHTAATGSLMAAATRRTFIIGGGSSSLWRRWRFSSINVGVTSTFYYLILLPRLPQHQRRQWWRHLLPRRWWRRRVGEQAQLPHHTLGE